MYYVNKTMYYVVYNIIINKRFKAYKYNKV